MVSINEMTGPAAYDAAGRSVIATDEAGSLRRVIEDRLGTPVLRSAAGAPAHTQSFGPWGRRVHESGATQSPLGFTGHQEDAATALTYMKARWYDSEVGVFVSTDPKQMAIGNPTSAHRYCYADHDPVGFVDPDGREAESGSTSCFGSEQDEVQNVDRRFNNLEIGPFVKSTLAPPAEPLCNGSPCLEQTDRFASLEDACDDTDLFCIRSEGQIEEAAQKALKSHKPVTVFVNGILNDLYSHVLALRAVREVTGGFTIGVFNPTNGLSIVGGAGDIARAFDRRAKDPIKRLAKIERRVFGILSELDVRLPAASPKASVWAHSEGSVIAQNAGEVLWLVLNQDNLKTQVGVAQPSIGNSGQLLFATGSLKRLPFSLQTFGAFEREFGVKVFLPKQREESLVRTSALGQVVVPIWHSEIHQINDLDIVALFGSRSSESGLQQRNGPRPRDPAAALLKLGPHKFLCNIQNAAVGQ